VLLRLSESIGLLVNIGALPDNIGALPDNIGALPVNIGIFFDYTETLFDGFGRPC
jgi:hypothetical protein